MRALVVMLLIVDGLLLAHGLTRPAAAPPPAPPSALLPLGVESLRLLSEASEVDRTRAAALAAAGGVCVRAGPLPDETDADAVVQRARSLGIEARPAAVELASGPPDLQVHLPPLPSAEQASRAVREFAALDIEAYVIPDGDLAGGVSLGTFTDAAEAEGRRGEVASLGYPVRVVEIPRMRRVWDVRLRGRDDESLDAFLLGLRRDWPELGGDRIACEAVGAATEPVSDGAGREAQALPRIARPPQGESTPP